MLTRNCRPAKQLPGSIHFLPPGTRGTAVASLIGPSIPCSSCWALPYWTPTQRHSCSASSRQAARASHAVTRKPSSTLLAEPDRWPCNTGAFSHYEPYQSRFSVAVHRSSASGLACTSTLSILIASWGRFFLSTCTASNLSSVSHPSSTLPKTVFFPSRCGAAAKVKNN